jgi:Zn-dependent peptidase ImmA (M78 family)
LYNDRYSVESKVKKAEVICNAVAAEILVPQFAFTREWSKAVRSDDTDVMITLETLARFFKCGITVVARKAYDNDLITFKQYQAVAQRAIQLFNEAKIRKKENKEGGGDYYRNAANRIDNRFFRKLVNSVYEGKTLYSDAFRLTNTNRTTFSKLAERTGGGAI